MSERETREQLESHRARLAHQNSRLQRDVVKLHNRLRRLENKVRKTIVIGETIDADGLYQLRQMVPNTPRKVRK